MYKRHLQQSAEETFIQMPQQWYVLCHHLPDENDVHVSLLVQQFKCKAGWNRAKIYISLNVTAIKTMEKFHWHLIPFRYKIFNNLVLVRLHNVRIVFTYG